MVEICDSTFLLDCFVGEDISVSAARESIFTLRGDKGEGELRNGEEDSGDETCGV